MRTSQNGINMIKKFEGCKLAAYRCAANVWTIGYGHTAGVTAGMRITPEQAESYLKEDLAKFEAKVMKYDLTYRWNQNEFDALVSFAYNVGNIEQLTAGGTRSRTVIASKMLSYNKAAGKELAGLTARRKTEQALFKTAGSTAASGSIQAAETGHVQLNYKAGDIYTVQNTMNVRDNPSTAGRQIGSLAPGTRIKNLATTRVGMEIWMYFGLDAKGREQWVCADNGSKAYID